MEQYVGKSWKKDNLFKVAIELRLEVDVHLHHTETTLNIQPDLLLVAVGKFWFEIYIYI